jgi:DNA polymerase delta subunit 1
MLHVTNFLHYFYIAAPVGFQKHDCEPFKLFLEGEVAKQHTLHSAAVHSVQMTMKENLYGFQGNQKSPYLKISVTDPRHINKVRRTVQEGNANYKGLWKVADGSILTFDNIQYVLRFMIDTKVSSFLT